MINVLYSFERGSELEYKSVYILTQLENHSQLLCGHDFANKTLLVNQFDVKSSKLEKVNKIT